MTRVPLDALHVADNSLAHKAGELLLGKEEYALYLAKTHFTGFEQTGYGLYAIRAFRICHDARIFPEQAWLDWLNGCFEQWSNCGGKKSLDVIMGIRAGGRFKRSPVRSALLRMRDTRIIEEVAKLTSLRRKLAVKVTVLDAAHMVSERMKYTACDRTGFGIEGLAEEKRRNSYCSTEWRPRRNQAEAFFQHALSRYTMPEIRTYFRTFPAHSIPARVKRNLQL